MLTSKVAEACNEGRKRYEEKIQAEADKEVVDDSEVAVVSAELKPGERKVISDGTEGPVVEIIKRTPGEAVEPSEPEPSEPEAAAAEPVAEDTTDVEKTGE